MKTNFTTSVKAVAMSALLAGAVLSTTALAAPVAISPNVESKTRIFLEALNSSAGKPLESLPAADARKVLEGAQAGAKLPAADVSHKTITVDGKPLNLVIVKPSGSKGTLPAFMFFHGGGWILGDYPTHERLIRDLVVSSGAAAVYVDYTRTPEARYPVAINQAYGATKWVAEHGAEIGVDGSRLAVAGNSVGGNMAAVVALMAKNKNGPTLKAEVLLWPVTDGTLSQASYKEFAEGHFLTRSLMAYMWDLYVPNKADRMAAYVAPLQASMAELKGLPKTYLAIAENDILRDEGLAYARKLDKAGVDVTAVEYTGMIHDFGLLNALANVSGTRAMISQAGDVLKTSLAK